MAYLDAVQGARRQGTAAAISAADIATGAVGTAELEDGSIVTVDVANDSITYAKIQNVSATDKVLGRSTAAAGDVEEIPCTASGRAMLAAATAAAQLLLMTTALKADLDKLGSSGAVVASGTQHAHVADISIAAVTGVDGAGSNAASKADVDTAFAAIVTRLNGIYDSLEAFKLNATS